MNAQLETNLVGRRVRFAHVDDPYEGAKPGERITDYLPRVGHTDWPGGRIGEVVAVTSDEDGRGFELHILGEDARVRPWHIALLESGLIRIQRFDTRPDPVAEALQQIADTLEHIHSAMHTIGGAR